MTKNMINAAAVAVLMVVGTASAATVEATSATTVSGGLTVSVTVLKAIRLKLEKGTGCDITGASSPFAMDFGSVDALGISDGACAGAGAGKIAPTTPGTDSAVYYTDYKITPIFTNQALVKAEVTAYVSSAFSGPSTVLKLKDGAASTSLADLSTTVGTPTSITGASGVDNNTVVTRYLGVAVSPTNSTTATVSGASSATITYTMTMK